MAATEIARVRSGFDVERRVLGDDSRGPFALDVSGLVVEGHAVRIDGELLVYEQDYFLNAEKATIELVESLRRGAVLTFSGKRRLSLGQTVRRRVLPDESGGKIVTAARRTRSSVRRSQVVSPRSESGDLEVSGVKRLQVAMGSTSEAALNQSLRLELSGKLADGVRVSGFLTDRSLPIQAAGRSRSIQDIDRVRLEVSSSTLSAELGDVDIAFDGTTFGRYRRRLQGVRFQASPEWGELDVFGAVSEGAWESRRITTQSGYQGPYLLASRARPLVAGSERLYQNGRQLRRGEGQDYVVDYDRGLVTFTPNRPITGLSRITTEFQAVDPEGRLRSVGLRGQTNQGGMRLGTTVIRESRQAGAPSLTDSGLTGGVSGPNAFLSVVDGGYEGRGLRLDGELSWASAAAAGQSERGHAGRVGLSWKSPEARAGRHGWSALRLSSSFRHVGETYRPMDRVESIANEGQWGWEQGGDYDIGTLASVDLHYLPTSFASVGIRYGRRAGLQSGHLQGTTITMGGGRLGDLSVSADRITREGGRLSRYAADGSASIGPVRATLRVLSETATGSAITGSRVFYSRPFETFPEGVRVREADLSSTIGSPSLSLRSSLTLSQVDQLMGAWSDSTRELVHTNQVESQFWNGFRLNGSFGQTLRRGPETVGQTRVVNLGRTQIHYRNPNGWLTQQVQYQVSSTGLAESYRVYVEVLDGQGSYVWEDVDGDGLQDDEEFVLEGGGNYEPLFGLSGSFEPVRESSVGTRTLIEFGKSAVGRVPLLGDLSLEVALESERRGRADEGAGISPWSHRTFEDHPSVVSSRRSVRTMGHLFRRRRLGSIRVDLRLSDDLDRRLSEDGRTTVQGWVFSGKLRPIKGWDVEALAERGHRDRAGSGAFAHAISEWSVELRNWLRLDGGWQTGLTVGYGRDQEVVRGLEARRVSIGPELRRAFRGKGRLTSRFDWSRVDSQDPIPLFLGLADGQRRGKNFRWRLGLDYRLSQYVDGFVTYDGTVRPERPALHVGRMELRANF
mgnify:FL=1